MKVRRLTSASAGFDAALALLTRYEAAQDAAAEAAVRAIVAEVRAKGDAAVLDYSRKFDGVSARSISELEIPAQKLKEALESMSAPQRNALDCAHERVRSFHERQLQRSWDYVDADGT